MDVLVTSELRSTWRLLLGAVGDLVQLVVWVLGTTWLGVVVLVRLGRSLRHAHELFRERLMCPRGHAAAMYGVFMCRCGARHEGWAFGRCRVCGQGAGWTPCTECGLPILSPLRWWQ